MSAIADTRFEERMAMMERGESFIVETEAFDCTSLFHDEPEKVRSYQVRALNNKYILLKTGQEASTGLQWERANNYVGYTNKRFKYPPNLNFTIAGFCADGLKWDAPTQTWQILTDWVKHLDEAIANTNDGASRSDSRYIVFEKCLIIFYILVKIIVF